MKLRLELLVWTGRVPLDTVTVSDSEPTSSLTASFTVRPETTSMACRSGLNPESSIATVYFPGSSPSTWNSPRSFVTAVGGGPAVPRDRDGNPGEGGPGRIGHDP